MSSTDLYNSLNGLYLLSSSGDPLGTDMLFSGDAESVVFLLDSVTNPDGTLSILALGEIQQANNLVLAADAAGRSLDVSIVCLDGQSSLLAGLSAGVTAYNLDTTTPEAVQAAEDFFLSETIQYAMPISLQSFHRPAAVTEVDIIQSAVISETLYGSLIGQLHVIPNYLEAALATTGPAIDLSDAYIDNSQFTTQRGAYDQIGEYVPDLQLVDQFGQSYSLLNDTAGLLVISICPTWCQPCQVYASQLAQIEAATDGALSFVEFIVENSAYQLAYTEDALAWATTYQLNVPVVTTDGDVVTLGNFALGTQSEEFTGFPDYIVIDGSTGEIVDRFIGYFGVDSMAAHLLDVEAARTGSFPGVTYTGNKSNDTFVGGVNADTISGMDGNDTLSGDRGNDTISGGNGNDVVNGGAGNDTLNGGAGKDTIKGDGGNDVIDGGASGDVLDGGTGYDTLSYLSSTAAVKVNLATRTATGGYATGDVFTNFERVSGSAYADTLTGDGRDNYIWGNNGNDTIFGGAGRDIIDGGQGNDLIEGGPDGDVLDGGDGNDTLSYASSNAAVVVDLSTNYVAGGDADGLIPESINNFENVIGSAFADVLTGDSGVNKLTGGSGNDTLEGGAGADTLAGGAGTDLLDYFTSNEGVTVSLAAGTANGGHATGDVFSGVEDLRGSNNADTLTGNNGANSLYGLAGNDIISGGGGNDTIEGGDGADILQGGSGRDTIVYERSQGAVSVSLVTGTGTGGEAEGDVISGVENIVGTTSNDTLIGNGSNNILNGGAGSDLLIGGAGIDTLSYAPSRVYGASSEGVHVNLLDSTAYGGDADGDVISGFENVVGGDGSDFFVGSSVANILDGGKGSDTVSYEAWASSLYLNLVTGIAGAGVEAADTLISIENAIGTSQNDTLIGNQFDNTFMGGAGADTMAGGDGSDTLDYTSSILGVTVDLQAGVCGGGDAEGDTFTGFENVIGGISDDTLIGDSGDNVLRGGEGDDILIGGSGFDTLIGGAGNDRFVFKSITDSGDTTDSYDQILGLETGDLIDFSAIDADLATDGLQHLVFDQDGELTKGEMQIVDVGEGVYGLFFNVDDDAEADMFVAFSVNEPIYYENFIL